MVVHDISVEADDRAELLDSSLEGLGAVDVWIPLLPGFVRGEDELCCAQWHVISLCFYVHRVPVQHAQQRVVREPSVELVEDHGGFSIVTVPENS